VGWAIALLFVPELIASALSKTRMFVSLKESKFLYRHVCAFGAALCIFAMMVCNLIGYSVGIGGTSRILNKIIFDSNDGGGIKLLLLVFAVFFSAAQIMFKLEKQDSQQK